MMQGKRLDGGGHDGSVAGFLTITHEGKYYINAPEIEECFSILEIDPSTVEPVAMKVYVANIIGNETELCPNCNKVLYDLLERNIYNYCLNCGQRLDWSVGDKL